MDHRRLDPSTSTDCRSLTVFVCGSFVVVPCDYMYVTVPRNYTVLPGPYYRVPYLYRPIAVVTPCLAVSQTEITSSVVKNHGWSVAGALRKSAARSVVDP